MQLVSYEYAVFLCKIGMDLSIIGLVISAMENGPAIWKHIRGKSGTITSRVESNEPEPGDNPE